MQNFVSAAVGMAVLAAVVRGVARRSAATLGNFWVDLYRSLVYILLPLCLIVSTLLIWQGVPQTFSRARDRARRFRARTQTIARGPVASQIAMKQLGTNGGGFYNSNSSVPFENPTGLSNFIEMLSILLIPAAQVFMFGKMVLRPAARVDGVRGDVRGLRRSGVAVNLPAEQHGSQVLRASGVNITRGTASRGGNMADKEVRFGIADTADVDGRDERRLERLRQRRLRRADARRRGGAAREPLPRRGDLRRGRIRPVRDVLLHRHRGLHRRA